ncbi:heme-binding protein [Herbiconiux moechotypicola]|uniref:Heme-degrading domain-containing protein n=1 Tax=Herbiconiux moechotypicola TaxID=637393 RepID=A0ABN3DC92_9MICO|nr:heme-binding protein [Herbiconiux moechotypicola]MCS5728747.1 heme-binding protein [Herbiconiux moechotypicola]
MKYAFDDPSLPVFTTTDLEAVAPLDVPEFGNDDAVELGSIAVDLIRERGLDLAVEVLLGDDTVYRAKLGDTGLGNDPWLAGKAAVVRHFKVPSLLVKRRFEEAGREFTEAEDPDIDHEVMRAHGGSVPIFAAGQLVGTITTSGEPDVIDHQTTADAVAAFLARRASAPQLT